MKYISLFFLPIALLVLSCNSDQTSTQSNSSSSSSQAKAENLDLTFEIKNMTPGPVFLIGNYQGQNFRVDSVNLDASGKVVFKKDEPIQQGMYYAVFPDKSNMKMLLGRDQSLRITADKNDLVGTIKIEGNKNTELLYENLLYEAKYAPRIGPINQGLQTTAQGTPEYESFSKQREALVTERNAFLEQLYQQAPNSFFTSFLKAGQNPEIRDIRNPDGSPNDQLQVYLYRNEFWDNVDFSQDRLMFTPVITNKLKRYSEQLTAQNPDSIIASSDFLIKKVLDRPEYFKYFANFITLKFEPTKAAIMDSEKIYVHMIKNYFTKDRAFWADSMTVFGLQRRIGEMSASLTGLKGPEVTANDPSGTPRSISDLKSDYLVVYMYNPDCEHCQVETPKLLQLWKNKSRKEFDVYAIALDTEDKKWKDYIQKNGLAWTNVYDPTNAAIYARYYVDITPEIYVLNRDRIIIGKNIKADQVQTIIDRDRNGS